VSGDERVGRSGPRSEPAAHVTSWDAPAWAASTHVDSGGVVQHTRPVAEVRLLDQEAGGAYLVEAVEIGQADWVDSDGDVVRVEREPSEILCGPMRLDSAGARHLAASLVVAADIIDAGLVQQLPEVDR
jgi:hypothetical protein